VSIFFRFDGFCLYLSMMADPGSHEAPPSFPTCVSTWFLVLLSLAPSDKL